MLDYAFIFPRQASESEWVEAEDEDDDEDEDEDEDDSEDEDEDGNSDETTDDDVDDVEVRHIFLIQQKIVVLCCSLGVHPL